MSQKRYQLYIQKPFFAMAILALLLMSCGPETEVQIQGKWIALELTEAQDTLDLPKNTVRLTFAPDRTYAYEGTLRYQEAGTYRAKGRVIYTRDTIHQEEEKAVHIERLRGDTLILNMVANKKPRRLVLFKEK